MATKTKMTRQSSKTTVLRKPRTHASGAQAPKLLDSQAPVDDGGEVYSVVDQIKRFRRPMSVSELAPILGVSEDVLYAMVRNGKIPQLIIPGRTLVRFDPASIVFWLCKHNPLLNQVQKAS